MAISRQDIRKMLEDEYIYQGKFKLSGGSLSDKYVDCRAAMLERPRMFRKFLTQELQRLGWPEPVATGNGGAIMLATVGLGCLWNPKGHGKEWSPSPTPGTEVVLFDDVKTTGGTLKRLREAAEAGGLVVVGEVVLYDKTDPEMTPTVYLASPYSSPIAGVAGDRFTAALKAVADLQTVGHLVYSPVVHFHPAAMRHKLPTDFEYWRRANLAFVARLDELWVLGIEGWQQSVGVLAEVEYAKALGKPVFVVDPESLERVKA